LRFLIDIIVALVVATTIGLATAWYAVENGHQYGAVTVGPWTAWPKAGDADADPYSVAMLARTGEVPLGAGEGLAFTAENDSGGDPLTSHCVYDVTGQTPPARLWTLTAYDAAGRLMGNPSRRFGFHSREIVRATDGSIDILVGPEVEPGNWLPIGYVDHFKLVFRFYDTPLTASSRIGDLTLPRIVKERCG
jgi:hypothetical protein